MSEPFDFDAFINGTALAKRKVHAFGVDHRDEIAHLQAEHDALPEEGADDRESSGENPRHALAQRIADLRAEMLKSKVEWTLRTLTPDEFAGLQVDDEDDANDTSSVVYEQIALMSRAPEGCANPSLYRDLPNLTAEQWRKVSGVIGVRQWGDLRTQADALVLSQVAVPDFSQSVSETLKPKRSSES